MYFAFNELYLYVMLYLMVSSVEAIKSTLNNSINLYSIFSIKSNLAYPSLYKKKTAKNLIFFKYN
jgi:hypothetical protein